MSAAAPDTTTTRPPGAKSAGLGRRFLARVVDAVIVGIPLSILLAVLGLPAPTIGMGGTEAWLESAMTAGLWFLYYAGFEATTGATFAKRILNLKVVTNGQDAAGVKGAAVRNAWILFGLIPAVGGVLLLVAVIWIAVSVGRSDADLGIHDRMAGTAVIDVR